MAVHIRKRRIDFIELYTPVSARDGYSNQVNYGSRSDHEAWSGLEGETTFQTGGPEDETLVIHGATGSYPLLHEKQENLPRDGVVTGMEKPQNSELRFKADEVEIVSLENQNGDLAARILDLELVQSGGIGRIAVFNQSEGLQLPKGSTAERPNTPNSGTIRYNTSSDLLELYSSGSWESVARSEKIRMSGGMSNSGWNVLSVSTPREPVMATLVYKNGNREWIVNPSLNSFQIHIQGNSVVVYFSGDNLTYYNGTSTGVDNNISGSDLWVHVVY